MKSQISKKLCRIISEAKDQATVDRSLFLWERLHKGLPVIDTTEEDNRHIEREKKQEMQPVTPDDKGNKDHKPDSTNKHKVIMPNGRTYLYTININGSMSTKEVNDYIPITDLRHEHITEIARHINENQIKENQKENTTMKKSIFTGLLLPSRTQKSVIRTTKPALKSTNAVSTIPVAAQPAEQPRQQWFKNPSYYDAIRQTPAAPTPAILPEVRTAPYSTMAQNLRNSRSDFSTLTGHQRAAVKAGLDVNTEGLERMTFDQMKQAASQINIDAAAVARRKMGMMY